MKEKTAIHTADSKWIFNAQDYYRYYFHSDTDNHCRGITCVSQPEIAAEKWEASSHADRVGQHRFDRSTNTCDLSIEKSFGKANKHRTQCQQEEEEGTHNRKESAWVMSVYYLLRKSVRMRKDFSFDCSRSLEVDCFVFFSYRIIHRNGNSVNA